jgi:hypothetical protein
MSEASRRQRIISILPSFESAVSRYFQDGEVNWKGSSFLEAAE